LKQKITMKKTTKKIVANVAAKATKAIKAIKAPAKKAAAPAKKRTSEPPATFISAQIDIGFGNHLYLRGEGPALSWDHGVAMDCVGNNLWTSSVKNAAAPVVFKVLVNDITWSAGDDFTVAPGQSVTITPAF
jgi:hypothetical protein